MMEENETLGQGEFGEVRIANYRGTQVSGCGQWGCGLVYITSAAGGCQVHPQQ